MGLRQTKKDKKSVGALVSPVVYDMLALQRMRRGTSFVKLVQEALEAHLDNTSVKIETDKTMQYILKHWQVKKDKTKPDQFIKDTMKELAGMGLSESTLYELRKEMEGIVK